MASYSILITVSVNLKVIWNTKGFFLIKNAFSPVIKLTSRQELNTSDHKLWWKNSTT